MTFLTKSSLEVLGEVMAARVREKAICQKKLETKTQYTLLEKFEEIYSRNFCNKRKATRLGGVGGGVQKSGAGPHRDLGWGRGRGPPLPPGLRLVLRLVSEFSYFSKNK